MFIEPYTLYSITPWRSSEAKSVHSVTKTNPPFPRSTGVYKYLLFLNKNTIGYTKSTREYGKLIKFLFTLIDLLHSHCCYNKFRDIGGNFK